MTFLKIQTSYFVECLSVWICLIILSCADFSSTFLAWIHLSSGGVLHFSWRQTMSIYSITIDVNCYHSIMRMSTRFFCYKVNNYFVGIFWDRVNILFHIKISTVLLFIKIFCLNQYYCSSLPSADFQIYFSFWIC